MEAVSSKVWTAEDLMNMPEIDGKCELVQGELIAAATGFRHDRLVMWIGHLLNLFLDEHDVGVVGGSDMGCRMKNGNVRCPDVSFTSKARAHEYVVEDLDGFFEGAPDLVVEVLSPSDRVEAAKRKAIEYFENGCQVCWIVDPRNRTVLVLESDGTERLLTDSDVLDGSHVLPGFSVPVSTLFKRPQW